jgi:transcriptional regulator with XRE-family HTH domain
VKHVDPLDSLKAFVAEYPSQLAAADALGISGAYLSDLLNGRRNINETMLKKLGLKRIVVKA